MADWRNVKRMRAEKALRDKKKKDAVANIVPEPKKPDPEAVKNILQLWEETKKKNANNKQ